MAPKSKAKAKAKAPPPELAPLEVEPQVTEEALEAAKQLKREEKAAMRAAREAEVAEQTAKMNFEVQVNETIEEGRKLEAEIKEAKDLGLSPFKAVRIRRKSKDLESSATDLLSTALDEIFLSCNCGLKTWPLIAFSGGAVSTTAFQPRLTGRCVRQKRTATPRVARPLTTSGGGQRAGLLCSSVYLATPYPS